MLQPSSCMVEYVLDDAAKVPNVASFDLSHVPAFGVGADVARDFRTDLVEGVDLTLVLRYSGDEMQLSILPRHPLRVLSGQFVFDREFLMGEKVLFNGYQSWTDTAEKDPYDRMLGIRVPRAAQDHWVLDGGGDYRFIDYPGEPGVMHGWTYAYFRGTAGVELVGSLDETRGLTLIGMDADAGQVIVEPEMPTEQLEAGKQHLLTALCVATDADADAGAAGASAGDPDAALDAAFSRWFALSGVRRRRALPLTGYSSWYRHYADINEGKLLHDLEGAYQAFSGFNTEGHTLAFQIDDGYALVGDWLGVRADKFPHGLAPLAQAARSLGFTPGLWMAPFVCERDSQLAAKHPDWILRDADGQPVVAGSHWSGSLALDTLNPDVRDYVTTCIRTVVQEWGFDLLKLDFLYAACMVPHGGMNRGQLMADGMRLLREAAGEDALLLGCGVPLGSAFGQVEYCRVGCDMGLDWDDKLYMRGSGRERVSTRNSLRDTTYRAPLNGRAFLNDPDVVLLRADVDLTDEQRDLVVNAAACLGGVLMTSDDMGEWTDGQRETFGRALALHKAANAR